MRKLFVLAFAAVAAASFGQNIVTNGSFETGDLTGWTVQHAGSFSGVTSGTFGAFAPQDGIYMTYMGAVSAGDAEDFYQDLATTAGTQYNVSFWAADSYGPGDANANLTVMFGGNSVFNGIPDGNNWTQYTGSFTATGSTTRLEVSGWESASYVLADNFNVTSAVPEPASMSVLGLGILAVIRRRRKA